MNKKLLILWGGGLGDGLVLRPLLLAAQAQQAELTLASVASHAGNVVEEMGIRATSITLSRSPMEAIKQLRKLSSADLCYLPPFTGMSTRLLASFAKAKRRYIGQYKQSVFIGEAIGQDAQALGLSQEILRPYGPGTIFGAEPQKNKRTSTILIHAGSRSSPTDGQAHHPNRWDTSRWHELLAGIRSRYSGKILIVGTPSERSILDSIIGDGNPFSCETALGLNLSELEATVINSSLVICHNSGVMHLALAHQRPTVAITGSTATYWRGAFKTCTIVSSSACEIRCNKRECPIPFFNAKCMTSITVQQVEQSVNSIISALGLH